MVRVVATLAAALAVLVPAGVDAASGVHMAPLQVSSNWAGYVASAPEGKPQITFTAASGTWTVPKAACTSAGGTSAAFWIGIGGFSATSPSLQQLGSSVDCNQTGAPMYLAWTEIVPAPAKYVRFVVRPGDTLSATVAIKGRRVTLGLQNVTRSTRFAKTFTVTHELDLSSAEWIAEAPSLCRTTQSCTVVPLTNFGTVRFTGATATGDGHTGAIADPRWLTTPLALVASNGFADYVDSNPAGALPRPLASGGRAFSVGYRATLSVGGQPVPSSPLQGAPLPPWYH